MKNLIKKISTVSVLAVLFFSYISPFFVYASTPTIEFELFAEEQNGTTGYWSWVILVKTTNVPTGTVLNTYFYHGTETGTSGTITTNSNGVATYLTGYTLLPSTATQEEKYSLEVILNYNGTISKTFGPRATPSNGVVPDIIIQGDPNTTIGGGTPPQDPPTEVDPDKTTTTDSTYKLLAPIGDFTEAPSNIGDYFNTIFKIAIGLCGALAVIMIIVGGIQYMGDESIFGKTEAKSKITAAIFGLLIALGAYALLNTINPALLGGKINIKQVNAEIDMDVHGDTPQSSAVNGKFCKGRVVEGAEVDTVTGRKWEEDSIERTALNNVGITVQRTTSCKKVGEKNCTSLTGLKTTSVIDFKKNKCKDCVVIINGATECWNHSGGTPHFPGNSIVDIDDTQSMDNYVQSGTKQPVKGTNFYQYTKDGIKFLDEGNHYHIISW